MHAERVDGYNPLAVADAIERKKAILLAGQGPVLLDTVTYRFSGHSPSDASAYRTKEEIDLWMQQDALGGLWQLSARARAHRRFHAMSDLQEEIGRATGQGVAGGGFAGNFAAL